MTRVLVTGATGFVGRQILAALARSGAELRAVVRTGSESRLPAVAARTQTVMSQDVFAEREVWWEEQCRGVDVVVHAAWYAEPGKYLVSERNLDCLVGSVALARGAIRAGVRRIVGVGTCAEYDQSSGVLSTDTPLRPSTPYAGAKAALYSALAPWLASQSVGFAWCRLFYLFGDGEDPRRLVPYLRHQLAAGLPVDLTSGTQVRDYLDVVDAGRRIAEVALSERTGAVNVCSGVPVTVRQLAERIADEYGRRDLLRFGARPDNIFDPPYVLGIPTP